MISVAILGSTGMLGSCLTEFLNSRRIAVTEINSTGISYFSKKAVRYDILDDSIHKLEKIIYSHKYIINCTGVVKQKIDHNNISSKINTLKVNSVFSLELTRLSEKLKIPLIQVGTDCVFSGNIGNYDENCVHDPSDIYGQSKSLGECTSNFLQLLRCSFVGKELSTKTGLMEWVLNQEKNAVIKGYKNHYWNGLTTLHISKLIHGIIDKNNFQPGTFHIVPKGTMSKMELLRVMANIFDRSDLIIKAIDSEVSVDRTLSTINSENNEKLWRDAGYNDPPSIDEMLKEYFYWIKTNPRTSNHE